MVLTRGVLCVSIAMAMMGVARADDHTWNVSTNYGLWETNGNWHLPRSYSSTDDNLTISNRTIVNFSPTAFVPHPGGCRLGGAGGGMAYPRNTMLPQTVRR